MKLFGGILVLVMGIIISIVAAWFSVTGMVALFNASAIGVMAMMVSLEAGKLVASGWLKMNWENKNVSLLHRGYLLGAVITLCLITSIGIYGYLSAGHLEQAAPKADIAVQTQPLELQLQQKNDENTRLNQRLNQIDQNIGVFLKNDKATQGLSASKSLQRERDQIQKKIDENNTAINGLHEKLGPLKMQSNAVEAKLGPVKYVAALFGWEDEESAVRLIILILMCAFDPLAIVLLLSAMTTFKEISDEKKGPPPGADWLEVVGGEEEEEADDAEPVSREEWFRQNPDMDPYEPVNIESEPLIDNQITIDFGDSGLDGGYDVQPFDTAPADKAETTDKSEGTKFSPEISFKLNAAPPLRSYSVFDWYANSPFAKKEGEEPTFKVLELPKDTGLPTGELEPEDRADYDLEDSDRDLEPFAEVGPDPQAVMLDELEQAVKVLENDLETEQAAHQDVRTERDLLAEKLADKEHDLDTLQEAYAYMQKAYSDAIAQVTELGEANQDLKKELDAASVDRDELISILERNPGILNEIEQIVEEDVVEEMSDREKLLDLLEKNPSVINDMAEIIAKSLTKGPGEPGWLDR